MTFGRCRRGDSACQCYLSQVNRETLTWGKYHVDFPSTTSHQEYPMYYIISRASGDIIDKLPLYASASDLNRWSSKDVSIVIYN